MPVPPQRHATTIGGSRTRRNYYAALLPHSYPDHLQLHNDLEPLESSPVAVFADAFAGAQGYSQHVVSLAAVLRVLQVPKGEHQRRLVNAARYE